MIDRIVIFHYHLNPGGVTSIIISQIKALKNIRPSIPVLVICGGCDNEEMVNGTGAELVVNPILNYLDPEHDAGQNERELEKIRQMLGLIVQKGDVLHCHNLNLGKNPLVTLAFHELLLSGHKVFNHAHDFSEDRPLNQDFLTEIIQHQNGFHLQEVMYPDHPNYLIGVLNSTDYHRVKNTGFNVDRLYMLPNPVAVPDKGALPEKATARKSIINAFGIPAGNKIFTYPVRVIERKNIGEYILLALLFPGASWLVTQPPRNPLELEDYRQWKTFCNENAIPLMFEAGIRLGFEDIMTGSDFCFTTSKKEGFGMAYMEPWLFNTPVKGRDLPYVTTDLKESGMQFPLLYPSLLVQGQQGKDFKDYTINEQQEIIRSSRNMKDQIMGFNPWLKNIQEEVDTVIIEQNKSLICNHYSVSTFGERLYGAYQRFN